LIIPNVIYVFKNKRESQMKIKQLSWVMVSILFLGMTGLCRADDDNRIISRLGENPPNNHLRTASFYLPFKDDKVEGLPGVVNGNVTRFYSKVWDGLYLQITTEPGQDGTAGYLFGFSQDEENQMPIPTNESRDVPTMLELTAADFRSDDNFTVRPLKPGPGTPSDRGAWRVIHYNGFDVNIRVLELSIGDTELKEKPYFKSVSCMVTVVEKAGAAK
jgi:hypothetical protein